MNFATSRLPVTPDVLAPDGSDVRVLLALPGGSMAHFQLLPGKTSTAVVHRTVDELWYVISGRGEMWREQSGRTGITPLEPGICLTIPAGTGFQFRSFGPDPLAAIAVTMPPWPGDDEAVPTAGPWPSTV